MAMMRIENIAIAAYDGDDDDDVFFRPHGCLWRGKKWLCKVFSLIPRQPVTRDDDDHDGDDHHQDYDHDIYIMMQCVSVCNEKWSLS